MSETRTITVYKFDELTEDAKGRAKDDAMKSRGYDWDGDAIFSLRALADHFGGTLKEYEIDFWDCFHSAAVFDMPEIGEEMDEPELAERVASLGQYNHETLRGLGDCVLTGYCADEDAIDGLRIAYHQGEVNLNALMQAAFATWLRAVKSDAKAQYEDENFAETAEANCCLYHEDGELYS